MQIVVTDRAGATHILQGKAGNSLMEILRDANMGIAADCGGACACATCHVYIHESAPNPLPAPDQAEIEMLEAVEALTAESRLSCQITCKPSNETIKLSIAPE